MTTEEVFPIYTREDVLNYLRSKIKSEEIVQVYMSTPMPHFGNMSPDEFVAHIGIVELGWNEVMGVFRRAMG
jgi:hypothetical protein